RRKRRSGETIIFSYPRHLRTSTANISFREELLPDSPEAALALLIIQYCFKYLRPSKIREQGWRHVDLAIGKLPEQEIRDSKFAACADQQIDLRQTRCVEIALNVVLGQIIDALALFQ